MFDINKKSGKGILTILKHFYNYCDTPEGKRLRRVPGNETHGGYTGFSPFLKSRRKTLRNYPSIDKERGPVLRKRKF